MAAVFRELVLSWDGEEYRIKPTMTLINRIESQGISLSGMAQMTMQGRPPFGHIATALSVFLVAAGAKVSPEDVYAEIMQSDEADLKSWIEALMHAAFPNAGKGEAPATAKKRTRK